MADIAEGDISLDLRRVLRGFMEEMKGPENFGHELGKILNDEEISVSSRVTLAGTMTKLLGQFGEGGEDDSLLSEEQLLARAQLLDAKINDAN